MSNRFETFAYLPPLTTAEVRGQLAKELSLGHVIMIEFAEASTDIRQGVLWESWPMAATARTQLDAACSQVEICKRQHPFAYVRVMAYSPKKQNFSHSFIVQAPHLA